MASPSRPATCICIAQVPVPAEVRLQHFTVVDFLLVNVLRQGNGESDQRVVRLIQSAPHGAATLALLSNIVTETATSLLLSSRQRAAISAGFSSRPLTPAPSSMAHDAPRTLSPPHPLAVSAGSFVPPFPPPPGGIHGPGRRHHGHPMGMHRGRGRGRRRGGRGRGDF